MRSALLNTPQGASEMGKDYLWGAYHCLGLGPENPSPDSWSFMCYNWTPWRSTSLLFIWGLCVDLCTRQSQRGSQVVFELGTSAGFFYSHSWIVHIHLLGLCFNLSIPLLKRKSFKKPLFTCAAAQTKGSGVSRRFPRLIEINSTPLVNGRK